jgi:protein-L-isoaspartate(D-aspartate) O-methyltransferase
MDFETARESMVREQIEARGVRDARVLAAMRSVPRHLFVSQALRERAYDDSPLPIGEQQTISQPYIVALMVEALELCGAERVLEIGTGSGYEAAVLAELCGELYSIERIPVLAERAAGLLGSLGYTNVTVRVGDGGGGWSDAAPFAAIVMSAAARQIPRPLVEQLRKGRDGLREGCLGECRFVKLIGTYGWEEPERGQ